MNHLKDYLVLMRLNRPIGILLLAWPTLWGLWFASNGVPEPRLLFIFIAGVVLMRSAGCVINDYADRAFDPFVERTRDRPIAAGRITPRAALSFFIILCLISFGLVLFLNTLTIALAVVGAILATSYPFLKRYTHLPQFYLGAAFGWGIIMGFAAVTGSVPPLAWILFLANIFWAVAYDTEYAMVDRDDDLRIGIKSTAILFGDYDRFMVAVMHILALALLVWVAILAERLFPYYLGLAIAAGTAVYQQYLIRDRNRTRCFRAFLNNNIFGAAVFAGLWVDYFVYGI